MVSQERRAAQGLLSSCALIAARLTWGWVLRKSGYDSEISHTGMPHVPRGNLVIRAPNNAIARLSSFEFDGELGGERTVWHL
jgi:hypothetical protein